MFNQRSIQRHQLPYYLTVFNRHTDQPLGFIGNLSEGGLLLISPYPMMLNVRFDMRLKIPGQLGQLRLVDFGALSLWSREDVTPGSFDSGFRLLSPPAEISEMIAALHHYFSFRPTPATLPCRTPRCDAPYSLEGKGCCQDQ